MDLLSFENEIPLWKNSKEMPSNLVVRIGSSPFAASKPSTWWITMTLTMIIASNCQFSTSKTVQLFRRSQAMRKTLHCTSSVAHGPPVASPMTWPARWYFVIPQTMLSRVTHCIFMLCATLALLSMARVVVAFFTKWAERRQLDLRQSKLKKCWQPSGIYTIEAEPSSLSRGIANDIDHDLLMLVNCILYIT